MVDAYTSCFESLGSNSTDRQLLECVATTCSKQSNDRLKSVALVFAGFLVFIMQVCYLHGMQRMPFFPLKSCGWRLNVLLLTAFLVSSALNFLF